MSDDDFKPPLDRRRCFKSEVLKAKIEQEAFTMERDDCYDWECWKVKISW